MPALIELPREQRFVKLFRWAQDVLPAFIADLNDESIVNRVSKNVILVLPLPGEEKEHTSNRPDPVIYVIDREGEDTIQLGLECNTLKSVEKLRNILDTYHAREKSEFLQCILNLDDSFETLVYAKLKPHNFAESPEYRVDWKCRSNRIAEAEIAQLFSRVDAIRRSGVEWRLKDGLSHPPEVPSIDIACTRAGRDEETFKRKLDQIRALFEITLRVKTVSDLKRAKAAEEKKPKTTKIRCIACNIDYTREEYQKDRFCRVCNNRITFVQTE